MSSARLGVRLVDERLHARPRGIAGAQDADPRHGRIDRVRLERVEEREVVPRRDGAATVAPRGFGTKERAVALASDAQVEPEDARAVEGRGRVVRVAEHEGREARLVARDISPRVVVDVVRVGRGEDVDARKRPQVFEDRGDIDASHDRSEPPRAHEACVMTCPRTPRTPLFRVRAKRARGGSDKKQREREPTHTADGDRDEVRLFLREEPLAFERGAQHGVDLAAEESHRDRDAQGPPREMHLERAHREHPEEEPSQERHDDAAQQRGERARKAHAAVDARGHLTEGRDEVDLLREAPNRSRTCRPPRRRWRSRRRPPRRRRPTCAR